MDIVRNYARIKNLKPLTQDELNKLIHHAHNPRNGHISATNKIIQANLGLVAKEARKWTTTLTFDDAFQQGVLGLYSAIRKYRPERKLCFSTYASYWIKQSISRYWNDTKNPVRRPDYIQGIQRRYNHLKAQDSTHTDDFWIKFIAKESGTPQESIRFAIRNNKCPVYLDAISPEYDEPIQIESIDSRSNLEKIDALKLLSYLNEDDRKILTMRMNGLTFQEIAEEFDLSRERIRQKQDIALRKLRSLLVASGELGKEE